MPKRQSNNKMSKDFRSKRKMTIEERLAVVARIQKYIADGLTVRQACANMGKHHGWYFNTRKKLEGMKDE